MQTPHRNTLLLLLIGALSLSCTTRKGSYPKSLLAAATAEDLMIRDVDIFNGLDSVLIQNMDVCIKEGKIFSIEKHSASKIWEMKVVDGSGKVLMPGLIDSHVHLGSSGAAPWGQVVANPEYNLEAYLYAGITTVYELGGIAPATNKLQKKLERGQIIGPRVFNTHVPISTKGAHPIPLGKEAAPFPLSIMIQALVPTISAPEEADRLIAKYSKKDIDYVKVVCDQLPSGTKQIRFDCLEALISASHKRGLKVFVHVGSAQNALDAIRAGADVLAHGIYRSEVTEEQAVIISESKVPVIYTLAGFEHTYQISEGNYTPSEMDEKLVPKEVIGPISGAQGKRMEEYDLMKAFALDIKLNRGYWKTNLQRLRKAGARIVVGTDSALPGTYPGSTYIRELQLLSDAGLSNYQILKGATSENATLFLESPEFGTVEANKTADLLLLESSPLEDISVLEAPVLIIQQGRLINPCDAQ